tara:strand:- start:4 stop:1110 length:1107 start_codon:yes stop_codon:yes gene_type:complete
MDLWHASFENFYKIFYMQIYLVGGAVRDKILGRPIKERDWLVVSSSPEEMLHLGYRPVGKQFPVFLHPETQEEYALARTEKKVSRGHGGFEFHTGPDVAIEDDLKRRDLTINAMAIDSEGKLIDPFGGLVDLENKILRHVSFAFKEDPLRVFRVARFISAFPGFSISEETKGLMMEIVSSGELIDLSPERVWSEFAKALATDNPDSFLNALADVGADRFWFSELSDKRRLIPDNVVSPEARYGALGWSLSESAAESVSKRLRTPNRFKRGIVNIAKYGHTLSRWEKAKPHKILEALESIKIFHDMAVGCALIDVVSACSGVDLDSLKELVKEVKLAVRASDLAENLDGVELGIAIKSERIKIIESYQS